MARQPTPLPLPTEILRIEHYAKTGLTADHIAVLLGYTPEEFAILIKRDPRITEALLIGRTRGIAAVADALFKSAKSGTDTGAARFYLERIGGGPFQAPKASPLIVVAPVQIDAIADRARVQEMERRFQRQRRLVDGGIEPERSADSHTAD